MSAGLADVRAAQAAEVVSQLPVEASLPAPLEEPFLDEVLAVTFVRHELLHLGQH